MAVKAAKKKELPKTFTINGTTYPARDIDFNMEADLGDLGVSLASISSNPNGFIRGYLAVCGDMTKYQAGQEISEHISAGNDLEEISEIVARKIEDSDFLKKLIERAANRMTQETPVETTEE